MRLRLVNWGSCITIHAEHKLNGTFSFCRLAQAIREKSSTYDTKLNDFLELR